MANRTIETRIIMRGVKEYTDAITLINRQLRTLDAEYKSLDAGNRDRQNAADVLKNKLDNLTRTYALLTEKSEQYRKILDKLEGPTEKAKKAYEDAAQALREYEARFTSQNKAVDTSAKEYTELVATLNSTREAYNRLDKANADAQQGLIRTSNAMADNADEAKLTTRYLDECSRSSDGNALSINKLGKAYDDAGDEAETLAHKIERLTDENEEVVTVISDALAASGVVATAKAISDALRECIEASIDFETALTGVAKTTTLTNTELREIGEEFKLLSTQIPMTASEIARMAEIGGQLGIADESLLEFARAMSDLAVSTSMSAESAAMTLAQLSAVTGVTADEYRNLGSSIVEVGNNFATTESNVMKMAQAVAGVATSAGLSTADMIGLATAVTSVGITSAMGGTNLGRLIQKMQGAVETGDQLDKWAAASGMSAIEFAAAWENDAASAIEAFISGVGKMANQSDDATQSVTTLLKSLGISEQRLIRLVVSVSGAQESTGLLTDALNKANTAWEENTALTREAELRYGTTESKLKMFRNSVANLKIEIGDRLTPALAAFSELGGNIVDVVTDLLAECPQLINILSSVLAGVVVLTVATTAHAVAVKYAAKAWAALSAAVTASGNWVSIAAAAITTLVTLIVGLATASSDAEVALDDLTVVASGIPDRLAEVSAALRTTGNNIESNAIYAAALYEKYTTLEAGTAAYDAVVRELCTVIPELNNYYDEENGKLEITANNLAVVIENYKKYAREKAKQEYANELVSAEAEAYVEMQAAVGGLAAAEAKRKATSKALADVTKEAIGYCYEHGESIEYLGFNTQKVTGSMSEQQRELVLLNNKLYDARIADDAAADSIRTYGKAVEETTVAHGIATEALDGYTESEKERADAVVEGTDVTVEAYEQQVAELDILIAKYIEYQQRFTEALNATVGMYDTMSTAAVTSVNTILQAWETQQEWFNAYSDNLNNLTERNGAAIAGSADAWNEFLANIADGSEESYGVIAGMSQASDDELKQMYDQFYESDDAKKHLADNLSTLAIEADEKMKGIVTSAEDMADGLNQSEAAKASGDATIGAYIDALNARLGEVQQIYNKIKWYSSQSIDGPHAQGLEYVPHDNYVSLLHEGEMVLTKAEARAYRDEKSSSSLYAPTSVSSIVNVYPQNLSQGQMDYIFDTVNRRLAR